VVLKFGIDETPLAVATAYLNANVRTTISASCVVSLYTKEDQKINLYLSNGVNSQPISTGQIICTVTRLSDSGQHRRHHRYHDSGVLLNH
jgi:hypothetical protein